MKYKGTFTKGRVSRRVYTFQDLDEAQSFANLFYGTITGQWIIL